MANSYPTTGYIQGQAMQNAQNYETPPAPSRLSSIAGHLESVNGEIGSAIERLVRLADRLNGAQPQEVQKADGSLRGSGGGLTTVIEGHLEYSNTLVNRLRNVLERLETL